TRPDVAAPAFRRARRQRGAGNDARAPGGSRAMSYRVLLLAALAGAACACNGAPGRPAPDSAVIAPDKVVDFDVLYATNCAGCHGANGSGGAAIGLADPVYLAIADDATIRRVTADGVPGTAMPAFAQSAGGLLTAAQIDVIVNGIRARWAKPAAPRRGRTPMTGTDGVSRRVFLARLGIGFNVIVAALLGVPIVRYILSPITRERRSGYESWLSLGALDQFPEGQTRFATYRNPV